MAVAQHYSDYDDDDKKGSPQHSCVSVDVYEILREIQQIRSQLDDRKSKISHERHAKTYQRSTLLPVLSQHDVTQQEQGLRSHHHDDHRRFVSSTRHDVGRKSSLSPVQHYTDHIHLKNSQHDRVQFSTYQRGHSSSPLLRKENHGDHPLAGAHHRHSSNDMMRAHPRCKPGSMSLKYNTKIFCSDLLNSGKALTMS